MSKVTGNMRFDLLRFHLCAAFGECVHCRKQSPGLYYSNRTSFWKILPERTGKSGVGHYGAHLSSLDRGGGAENQRNKQEIYTHLTSCDYPF